MEAAAAAEGAEPGSGGAGGAEEPVVSLAEVLAENEELEKEARAVLGGSDHERCSYSQGAVKRQALYACSTCTPPGEEPAGICLACSYECHGTHRLFELYTKRNFCCDCGNSKFKNLQCKLLPEKSKVNSGNKYNDNFYGLYCTCKRPYPDPEDEIPDEMIQCIVCEDWFHGRHLGAVPPESGDFHEMVCQACMNHCQFLWAYASQLAVPPLTKVNSLEDEGIVLKVDESEEQKKEIKKESEVEHPEKKEEKQMEQFNEPSTSSGSACPEVVTKSEKPVCKLKELQSKQFLKKDTATFWPSNWRSKLCTCEDCLKMYSELEVQFLTDECDTVLAYENKGTSDQETERRDPLMDTLNSMNRVQQVELICEYNDLKTELTDYLRRFADEGTVVKREDIQHFFEEFQSRKRQRTNRMQYYCS
ncbi:putative E3 ubiquitin-protein ligase UBR7 [Heliangelus exortis]|uniref:putative E3 ubiquitin-protein ligase UBR7 n=1 Tax=Heliangelus exortis TaxID=472823 RepID=UPI003A909C0E